MNKNERNAAKRIKRVNALHAAIVAAGPKGIKKARLTKLAQSEKALDRYLRELKGDGLVFMVPNGVGPSDYFGREDWADACKAAMRQESKRKAVQNTLRYRAKQTARWVETIRVAQRPRPQEHQKITIKPPKPTPMQVFSSAEADYSRAVITRIPTPPGRWSTHAEFAQYHQAVQALRGAA